MQAEQFYLVSTASNFVVQAGATDGQPPTLQPQDTSNPLQLWVMQAQVSGGFQGVALVNPATGNSVTYQGLGETLIMQPYSPGSGDSDSFLLFQADGPGSNLRIALAKNASLFWSDFAGTLGAPISLNSFPTSFMTFAWTLQLAGASADTVAVPAMVGEQVAATATA